MKTKILILFLALAPVMMEAQFTFTTNSGAITITGYNPAAGLNVVIPASTNGYPVNAIGASAFFDLTITNVTIPNSVTSIGNNAFLNCFGLTSITVDAANANYSSTNGVLFDKDQATLIQYPIGLTNSSYTIPNSVTSIGEGAFDDCYDLTSVTIPDSVTSIGDEAFDDCYGLTSVTIPNSVTSIGDGAFEYCYSLRSMTIPNSVTSIGQYAFFYCINLTSITFSGNAPLVDGVAGSADSTVFDGDSGAVYYLPGTTGWDSTFGSWPTVELFTPPQIGGGIGIQSGNFGFTITGVSNQVVTIEASTNLVNWQPVWTNTLSGASTNFIDSQWTNFPNRFYRAARYAVGGTLTGLPAGDTITLQDNGSDSLTLSTNGTFTFPTALPNGQSYFVTVSGTGGGTSLQTAIYPPVTANGSGTISGANVTNVAVQCTPIYTGNLDVDMYNAAVEDGTANGGVPGVMLTENGGPVRVTAAGPDAEYSDDIAEIYSGSCKFTIVVGTASCSSTTFPSGTHVIQFGTVLECGFGPYRY